MKKKNGKKIGKLVLSFIIIILAVALIWNFTLRGLIYRDFFNASSARERIPGLISGFVPQGVTYLDRDSCTLICGYMPGESPSRIYKVYSDGRTVAIELQREDGSAYTGHAGGITASGDYVYVSNQSKLFVLDAEKLKNAQGGSIAFEGYIPVPCNASFCSSDGNHVYVGEYHAKGYNTDDSHVFDVSGGKQSALLFSYRLEEGGTFGLADTSVPEAAYSICDNVQGFAMLSEEKGVVSCSSGFTDSRLSFYNLPGDAASYLTLTGEGKQVKAAGSVDAGAFPLYYLDADSLDHTVKAPHMSEDLEYRDGSLLINFEAGARKFGLGLLPISITRIMAMQL